MSALPNGSAARTLAPLHPILVSPRPIDRKSSFMVATDHKPLPRWLTRLLGNWEKHTRFTLTLHKIRSNVQLNVDHVALEAAHVV